MELSSKQTLLKPEHEVIVRNVYNHFYSTGYLIDSFDEYLSKVLFTYPIPGERAGLVIRRSIADERIALADMVLDGYCPRILTLKCVIALCSAFDGIQWFMAYTGHASNIKTVNKICERIGLQEVSLNLYAIRLDIYGGG
jgi:hypothetical protein